MEDKLWTLIYQIEEIGSKLDRILPPIYHETKREYVKEMGNITNQKLFEAKTWLMALSERLNQTQ